MRSLSSATISALFASETDEVFLVLITITHDDLVETIRVTSDAVDTVSNGNTFYAYPFDIQLPSDEENSPPRASLVIDNVSREIADSLRSISTPASFKMEVIRAADPDTIEASWDNFELKKIHGDVFQIAGELTIEDVITEPFPGDSFTPSKFRGLFS